MSFPGKSFKNQYMILHFLFSYPQQPWKCVWDGGITNLGPWGIMMGQVTHQFRMYM